MVLEKIYLVKKYVFTYLSLSKSLKSRNVTDFIIKTFYESLIVTSSDLLVNTQL